MMKKLLLLVALVATTTFYGQDSWTWGPNVTGDTMIQDTAVDADVIYTSDLDVQVGGIKFEIWSVSGGPWSQGWRAWFQNSTVLPAGTNMAGTVTMTNFPAAITTNATNGGVVMTKAQLIAANPNGTAGPPTNYYFELRTNPASTDPDFTPTKPGTAFISFASNPALSIDDALLGNVKVYPNPVINELRLADYQNIKTVSIHNLLGQKVKQLKADRNIDVSELTTGVYILKTDTGATSKFVKK